MFRTRIASIVLLIGCIWVFLGCGHNQPKNQVVDDLFYEGCASPPCWIGIQIDSTSFSEARVIVEMRF